MRGAAGLDCRPCARRPCNHASHRGADIVKRSLVFAWIAGAWIVVLREVIEDCIGLSAQPGAQTTWVHDSGVHWAVCYQYIASGVLPSQTWATHWGTNFAYDYAISAHAAGCVPEFDYYQLVPTTGKEGAAAEHGTLENAAIMADYYKDFTTLLQQLHKYGGKAVVHVEPDLWGYLETLTMATGNFITWSTVSRERCCTCAICMRLM